MTNKGGDMTAIFKNNCNRPVRLAARRNTSAGGFAALDEAEAKKAEIEKTSMNTAIKEEIE
jgi:hypothetical protein